MAVLLFMYWGGTLLGILPGNPGVSWQGHLFGAGAGVLAAWLVTVASRRLSGLYARSNTIPEWPF